MRVHAGACHGTRNATNAPFSFRQKVAPGLCVRPRSACDLPSARARVTTFSTVGKFKENKDTPKGNVVRRHTARTDPHEGERATRHPPILSEYLSALHMCAV